MRSVFLVSARTDKEFLRIELNSSRPFGCLCTHVRANSKKELMENRQNAYNAHVCRQFVGWMWCARSRSHTIPIYSVARTPLMLTGMVSATYIAISSELNSSVLFIYYRRWKIGDSPFLVGCASTKRNSRHFHFFARTNHSFFVCSQTVRCRHRLWMP